MCVLSCIHHRTILLLIELGHDLRRVPACATMIFENFRSVSFRDSFFSVTGVVPSALATSQDIARGEGQGFDTWLRHYSTHGLWECRQDTFKVNRICGGFGLP